MAKAKSSNSRCSSTKSPLAPPWFALPPLLLTLPLLGLLPLLENDGAEDGGASVTVQRPQKTKGADFRPNKSTEPANGLRLSVLLLVVAPCSLTSCNTALLPVLSAPWLLASSLLRPALSKRAASGAEPPRHWWDLKKNESWRPLRAHSFGYLLPAPLPASMALTKSTTASAHSTSPDRGLNSRARAAVTSWHQDF